MSTEEVQTEVSNTEVQVQSSSGSTLEQVQEVQDSGPGSSPASAEVTDAIDKDQSPEPVRTAVGVSVIQFAPTTCLSANGSKGQEADSDSDDAQNAGTSALMDSGDSGGRNSSSPPTASDFRELVLFSPRSSQSPQSPGRPGPIRSESSLIRAEYLQNYLRSMYAFRNPYLSRRARSYQRFSPSIRSAQPTIRVHPYHPRPTTRPSVPASPPLPRLPWPESPESEWQTVNINFVDPYGVRKLPTADQEL